MSSFSQADLIASICRESFWEFVQEFWEEVPGAGKLIPNWHMETFCQELQTVAERVFKNRPKKYDLVCNVSPGTSKSTIFSILFQPWTWTRLPSARHLTASHTDTLAMDLSNKSRHVVKSEKYRDCFPDIQLRSDQDTKGYFANTHGGDRLICTVGGKSPMGFHALFVCVDDPLDPKKAVSEAELKAAKDFYDSVIPGRKVNKEVSVEMTVMQRLHEEDPTGHLLDRAKREGAGKIRHICLPAELADNISPPELAEKYQDGLMDPVRLPRSVLRDMAVTMGAYSFAGQFMQSPTPLGGGMFKAEWMNRRVKAAPYDCRRIRYWDRAASLQGCFTAGVLLAKSSDGSYYVEHCYKGQWEPDERNRKMRAIALRDRSKYGPKHEPTIYVEAEGGSSGRDAWLGVVRALEGFRVVEDRVTGKKEVRAEPWACQLSAGNVFLVEDDSWDIPSYVSEHAQFPLGKYLDQVDASSGAFNLLTGVRQAQGLRSYSLNKGKKNSLRMILVNKEELANTIIEDHHSLLIHFSDIPLESSIQPLHGLHKVLGYLPLSFVNIEPRDYQDRWNEVLPGFDKKPEELILNREQGKSLWSFLLRGRDPSPLSWVFCDEDEKRALSVLYALSDTLHLPRNSTVFQSSDPDNNHGGDPPNRHIYDLVRMTRGLVV